MAGGTEVSEHNFSQKTIYPRFIHQALASLLNKRAGGVVKEKDLFELPALPKKVLSINISL